MGVEGIGNNVSAYPSSKASAEGVKLETPPPPPPAPRATPPQYESGFDAAPAAGATALQPPSAPPPPPSPDPSLKDEVNARRMGAPLAKPAENRPASVDDTVKDVEKKLEQGPFTTPADAVDAMNQLKKLPPEQQSEALDKLGKKGNVSTMIDALPEAKRGELEPLMKNAKDPAIKARLWEATQTAKATDRINSEISKLGTSPADLEKKATLERTLTAEKAEIREEVQFLRAKPGGVDKASLAKMMERKDLELDIEVKHGVNLTNETGVRPGAGGTKIVWEKDELEAAERTFSQTPKAHLTQVHEYRREDVGAGGRNADHSPNNGTIRIFDNACKRGVDGQLLHQKGQAAGDIGGTRELSTPELVKKGGAQATFLEWTLQHELGHHVHDFHAPGVLDKYKEAMEVKVQSRDEALTTIGATELAKVDAEAAAASSASPPRAPTPVVVNGRGYVRDGDKVRSYAADMFPGGEPTSEYFSEHYNQAILQPESTAKEYLDVPQKAAAAARAERDALRASGASPADLAKADAKVALAEREATTWKKSYDLMRNDVFHTDTAVDAAAARLSAKGASPEQIDAFRKRCERVSTPDQVARLEAQGPLAW
ncbi:MAG: hypothetical protein JNK82_11475 [Myxococcaceae bacterium]|nr:hypothetical protein [Myxococcaceae bacterium]